MHIEESIQQRVEQILSAGHPNMGDALGLIYQKITKTEVVAEMPVNSQTVQPFGILHGGASVALAETLASIGAWVNLTDESKVPVGLEINANHIRQVPLGETVTGRAAPIHRGSQTQVWDIRIETSTGKLVSICRCTILVVRKKS
jgi:1,4-dihydroxy-2-naphthoyl-CoA hydrolase